MKQTLFIVVGFIIGSVITAYITTSRLSTVVMDVQESKITFDSTVAQIKANAEATGWKIPKEYDIKQNLADAGYSISNVHVISMCKPEFAYNLISNDDNKPLTGIMPCRIAVFETAEGKVFVSHLNGKMIGRMYGGEVEKVLNDVTKSQEEILNPIVYDTQ